MEPTLLVPGMLCTDEIFAPQIRALWPIGPVMIGATQVGETIAEMAAAILAAAPPRFALVGYSLGGYISFEIMRQAPQRVTRLALLDTSARPDTPEQTTQRRALLARARAEDFASVVAELLGAILHPAHRNDPTLRAVNRRMVLTIGMEGFARQTEAAIGRIDSRPGLSSISVPTLVLVGDSDLLTPPELSEEIAATIRDAKLVIVPQSGHGTPLEQPEPVSRALVEWKTRT